MYLRNFLFGKVSWCVNGPFALHNEHVHAASAHNMQPEHKDSACAAVHASQSTELHHSLNYTNTTSMQQYDRLLKNKNNCTTHHKHKMLYAHTQVTYYLTFWRWNYFF